MNENCEMGECNDRRWGDAPVLPELPSDGGGDGGGGGGGEGHKYTFTSTATGWQVREDGRVIYTYTDKNDDTTYSWQATADGWLVRDNKGNVVFNYTDKDKDTTYSFEQTDGCGIVVRDNTGKVVFEYKNECAGTTYSFEQKGVDFVVTNDKTNQVVFTYKGTVDTNTTYNFEDYKKGFKVTDSEGAVAYIYDPELGDRSDGSYPLDTLLTTVIKGHTTVATGQIVGFTPADLVIGETLVYDGVGTVGVITKDNGDGTYEVTTMTISPGSRQGVRLGSVENESDLPATCADAEAKGWQTPQLGDFAYVTKNEGGEDVISEYVITNIDDDCNITWTFSHSFNAGDYQEQSTNSMAGMILTGGVVAGTFGTPIDPSTLIRGVMRNGVLLTPDAQGKVNVIVDDSHVIVNALPTTGIKDNVEYIVIDADKKVTSTWVHDPTGWYQTYEQPKDTPSHIIVDALPTTGIEEGVEYVVVDTNNQVTGTWVYNPTKGWLQTEKLEKPGHIVVDKLPTTGIDTQAEYVVVGDLTKPVDTFKATYVYTDSGWIKTSEATGGGGGHIAVTALPTTDIVEGAEYIVMTDTSDPSTITGTWVRVNGNWVQTEKLDDNGFHIVTSLPTSNIDDKNTYIVVTDLNNPDTTFVSQAAYDGASKKWIDLTPKNTNIYYNVNRDDGEVKWGVFGTSTKALSAVNDIVPWTLARGTWDNDGAPAGTIKVPANKTVEINVYVPLKNTTAQTTAPDIVFAWYNQVTGARLDIGTWNSYTSGNSPSSAGNRYTYSAFRSFIYANDTGAPVYIQLKVNSFYTAGEIQGGYAHCNIKEIGRVVDPVVYLNNAEGVEDTPVGNIISYMGKDVPKHYLACDGSTYNIGTYPALEAHILKQFGTINYFGGDGTTTWAVPDLQGEFLRGTGTNSHTNATLGVKEGSGAAVGVHQQATTVPNILQYGSTNGLFLWTGTKRTQHLNPVAIDATSPTTTDGFNAANMTHTDNSDPRNAYITARPTNTSVKYCIKYEVVPRVIVDAGTYKVSVPFTAANNSIAVFDTANAKDDTTMVKDTTHLVAPVDGYYAIGYQGSGAGAWTQQMSLIINDNSAEGIWNSGVGVSSVFRLSAGDTVTFRCGTLTSDKAGVLNMALINTVTDHKVAELMQKPNLWTPGVEQNFGDNVYGIRYTGSIANKTAGTRAQVFIDTTRTNKNYIMMSRGGVLDRSGYGGFDPFVGDMLSAANSSITSTSGTVHFEMNITASGVCIGYIDSSVRTCPYDIWMIYRKK